MTIISAFCQVDGKVAGILGSGGESCWKKQQKTPLLILNLIYFHIHGDKNQAVQGRAFFAHGMCFHGGVCSLIKGRDGENISDSRERQAGALLAVQL